MKILRVNEPSIWEHTAYASIEQYKMLEHAKIEKSEVLAPAFCGFFAAPSVWEALGAERT